VILGHLAARHGALSDCRVSTPHAVVASSELGSEASLGRPRFVSLRLTSSATQGRGRRVVVAVSLIAVSLIAGKSRGRIRRDGLGS